MYWISLLCAETCGKTCSAVLQDTTVFMAFHKDKLHTPPWKETNGSKQQHGKGWIVLRLESRDLRQNCPNICSTNTVNTFCRRCNFGWRLSAAWEFVAGKSIVVLTWQTGCQHWFADPPVMRGAVGHTAALHSDSCPNLSVAPVRINHLSCCSVRIRDCVTVVAGHQANRRRSGMHNILNWIINTPKQIRWRGVWNRDLLRMLVVRPACDHQNCWLVRR
jgi:hypothetical protein